MCEFHKKIYLLASKIPKRDRFGIHKTIEDLSLELVRSVISAAFEQKNRKTELLETARVTTEVLKRLVRIVNELNIIPLHAYLALESDLQEISKMTNGWIKYLAAAQ